MGFGAESFLILVGYTWSYKLAFTVEHIQPFYSRLGLLKIINHQAPTTRLIIQNDEFFYESTAATKIIDL
jgi:hypothetical protein